jgi:hypothetical protein
MPQDRVPGPDQNSATNDLAKVLVGMLERCEAKPPFDAVPSQMAKHTVEQSNAVIGQLRDDIEDGRGKHRNVTAPPRPFQRPIHSSRR